ncbi:MAG: DUF3021 domain-containing protein [Lachnospiraceae bacterium]|nr:DUF3021 domain-containing protein [Lachnospiraceae bacterium]
MRWFGNFVKWFLYITTGILIVCGINYKLAGIEMITVNIFWMILFSGFVTTLATVLLLPKEKDGRIKSYIKFALHYIALCVIMIPLGVWFDWIKFNLTGIVTMMIDVGGVCLSSMFVYYIIDCKQADEINRMLKKKYGDSEQ